MERSDDYTPLDLHCVNCGSALSARRKWGSTISIGGLIPLEYVHTQSGSAECVVKRTAQPYSGWDASANYEKVKEKSATSNTE